MTKLIATNNRKMKIKNTIFTGFKNHKIVSGKLKKICVRPKHDKLQNIAERNKRTLK